MRAAELEPKREIIISWTNRHVQLDIMEREKKTSA